MSNKNDIQAFDQFFKNELEKASVNPPAGLWESIASQTSTINTVTSVSNWSLTWFKTLLISSTITIGSIVLYQFNQPNQTEIKEKQIESEKTTVQSPVSNEVKITEFLEDKKTNTFSEKKSTIKNRIATSLFPKNETNDKIEKTTEIVKSIDVNNGLLNFPKNIVPAIIIKPQTNEVEAKSEENELNLTDSEEKTTVFEDDHKATIINSEINIPNVVTPNGDGLNDTYLIEIQGEEYFEMIVYNFKMEKLFETKSKYIAWDCKLPNGEPAPSGNYTVFLKYKFHNQEFESQYIKLKVIK